jgi:predicted Kef-type K+ transport protein
MTIALILGAYFAGLLAKQFSFPPLVGYLFAGFALHLAGFNLTADVQLIADLGITLMLFTIGLKINIKDLIARQVWGSALSHMGLWMVACLLINGAMGALGLLLFDLTMLETAILIFALSFSSTVCVIKVLEEAGEIRSRQATISVGILIIQDLVAVGFLVIATGVLPSPWAVLLLLLPLIRPLLDKILAATGHGELLPLAGLMLALGAYALFELVSVKGDFGALIVGMVVATSPKASELYKSLISFKDLFLIAFFLSIGLSALPDSYMLFLASLLLLLLPLKFLLFYCVLSLLAFRARTAFLSALLLANFSEFGLIVVALSVKEGLLDQVWLVVLAITAAQSFVITSLLYKNAHVFYARLSPFLLRFQRQKATDSSTIQKVPGANVLVIGMGRVGRGVCESLERQGIEHVWGVEVDKHRVALLTDVGINNVVHGDADDYEFWEAQDLSTVRLVMLATPNVDEIINIIKQLRLAGFSGRIAAIAQHDDEREALLNHGADVAFNYYQEVGHGFAEESKHLFS